MSEKRTAGKWNTRTHKYEPYELPDGAVMLALDMDMVVRCASCGIAIRFGETYTSRLIHNEHGIGYAVCPSCYEEEWNEEK